MAFYVEITEPALVDAEEYVRYLCDIKGEREFAQRWLHGLTERIESLEELPERCPVIPEQSEFPLRSAI